MSEERVKEIMGDLLRSRIKVHHGEAVSVMIESDDLVINVEKFSSANIRGIVSCDDAWSFRRSMKILETLEGLTWMENKINSVLKALRDSA